MKKRIFINFSAILLMILFLYTGVSKLLDYTVFKEQLADSPILKPVSGATAIGLPTIEILLTILLLIPAWRLIGFYLSFILMVLFTFYILAILSFSDKLPCSCGGVLAELSWPQHLILNITFILVSLTSIVLERNEKRGIQASKDSPKIQLNA